MALDIHFHMDISEVDKLSMVENKVLIEVFDKRNISDGGIILPVSNDDPFVPDRGIVYKKPDGITCFNVGDYVIIEKYKGKRIFANGTDRQFILLDASYVLSIVDEN